MLTSSSIKGAKWLGLNHNELAKTIYLLYFNSCYIMCMYDMLFSMHTQAYLLNLS